MSNARVSSKWTTDRASGLALAAMLLLPRVAEAQAPDGYALYDEPGIEIQPASPVSVPTVHRSSDPCRHGVVCAKAPGTDVLLEARAGYTFGDWSPATVEATFGLGNFGLGLPRNILFIGEVGLTTDARATDDVDVRFSTVDFSGGVRAYWPTRGPFALYGDVLFGAASHWLDLEGPASGADDHLWTIMGQLAVGFELHLVGPLSLVGRAKVSFFGAEGALLVAMAANGEPQTLAYARPAYEREVEVGAVRLAVTAGPSLSF